ncbi:MAG: Uma2 family endonuclease [Chroococcidiopsidaceae cyanobacterium CP_BM_ER_R8_30]|nr:Uma2 family endonuclease [Chroococcidiopsidaceae cyanobacterium CP_BM_ER_R8_30]
MTIASERKISTDEEFMALPEDGRYELVNGKLVNMGSSGMEHGAIGSFLGGSLALYVRSNKLGAICDSSTAFTMKTGNKRAPDVSFIAKERLQGVKRLPKGYFQGSPDLALGNPLSQQYSGGNSRQDCGVFRQRNAPGLGDSP